MDSTAAPGNASSRCADEDEYQRDRGGRACQQILKCKVDIYMLFRSKTVRIIQNECAMWLLLSRVQFLFAAAYRLPARPARRQP